MLAISFRPGDDPLKRANRWDDPACTGVRGDLVGDLRSHLRPPRRRGLPLDARV